MTHDEVIARQAKRLEELSEEVDDLKDRHRKAIRHIVCVGGPLNDNKLAFTHEQQQVFSAILNELE